VLEWLQRPAERRPHLVTLYFSDVDAASHRGPLGSRAVEEAARAVDRAVGALAAGIEALPIRDQVYLVLTSDHGMVETTPAQAVRLESLIDPAEIETAFGGPVGNIHLRGGSRRAAFVRNRVNSQLTHGRAYLRQDVPERHVYRDPRVGDVVVIMDEGWLLATPSSRDRYPTGPWGMHGWDPALTSMHATFVVAGPGIRRGATIGTVANIDVYPFMAELLGLRPAAGIDGRPGEIGKRVTRGEDGTARSSSSQWPVNRGSPGNWLEPPRSTWALADRQN
jgi:predicted AlkP superfamily pyrophosphatase or phosphodiesterase